MESPVRCRAISTNNWWKDRRDYLATVAKHNIFFASRTYEGIGMSMLEAMAMGLCVVAPDRPTHNEYISHKKNGILYDPMNAKPIDLTHVKELGARARRSIEQGYSRWSAAQDQLLSFISVPTSDFDLMLTRCSA